VKLERNPFEPASDGEHLCTVADVIDLGMQQSQFGTKRRLKLVLITDEQDSEGNPIRIITWTTASIHKSSKLTSLVKVLLGKDPGIVFETEALIGCSLAVTTEQVTKSDGQVFANIAGFRKLSKNEHGPLVPLNFVRAGADDKLSAGPPSGQKAKTNGGARKVVARNQSHNIHNVDITDADVAFPGEA
jgi:hypothetical protein